LNSVVVTGFCEHPGFRTGADDEMVTPSRTEGAAGDALGLDALDVVPHDSLKRAQRRSCHTLLRWHRSFRHQFDLALVESLLAGHGDRRSLIGSICGVPPHHLDAASVSLLERRDDERLAVLAIALLPLDDGAGHCLPFETSRLAHVDPLLVTAIRRSTRP
jgi:hypothetical protein